MSKIWLTLVVLVVAPFGFSPVGAAVVSDVVHAPISEIYTFDRIDLGWTLDTADADSIVVEFGDGSQSVQPGSLLQIRHFYRGEGLFRVTVTAWRGGQASQATDPTPILVQRRFAPGPNVFFLHHSTGRYMMRDSGFRSLIDSHNNQAGTAIRLWDHDYASGNTYTGLILPDSTVYRDWIYGSEANNIMPSGYLDVFVNAPAFRDSIFNRHDVILIKNDHATGDITSEDQLLTYQDSYLQIRAVMDQFPDKLFILLSGPSRQPDNTTNDTADRARRFYDWLQGPAFMNGHPNICFFDLFDELSNPDEANDPERNMIRPEYRLSSTWDDHPNLLANVTIGPRLADFLLRVIDPGFYLDPSAVPIRPDFGAELKPAVPNPFNPSTRLIWEMAQPGVVNLRIYDVAGSLVRSLVVGAEQQAGRHKTVWRGLDDQGRPQPSGIYFYRLEIDGRSLTRRMALIR